MLNGKMMFGVNHFTLLVGQQRAALQLGFSVTQPQGRIHDVEIIIQQREPQIVRPHAVGTVLIHTQRGIRAGLRFKLLIERRKTAVEADHQRQLFTRGQLNQSFSILHIFRQRLINADVNACVQQLAHHLEVRRG